MRRELVVPEHAETVFVLPTSTARSVVILGQMVARERPTVVGSLTLMRGILSFVCLIGARRVACGSSDKPPGPLAKHFDEMYIAALPLDQKATVVQTQQNWNVARMENANADAQVKEADSQLHQARNDQKASRLAIDSALRTRRAPTPRPT